MENEESTGLRFVPVPHGVYGRGRARTNPIEAAQIAAAVEEHVRDHPDLTLGVVALSQAQQMAILQEIEILRRRSDQFAAFESSHPHERFFVKNLENVQGDERDVILISVGYGRSEGGLMTLNFGPVNQEGGERRLNVLISRARESCAVFSNFSANDLDLRDTQARGLAVLKVFLKYAQTRELDVPLVSGRGPESPFEEAVLDALSSQGWVVDCQVGTAGFFVDLAVKDPERPGRYLLGIECDGASYHSARSARDRDRLREAVLRRKGWEIHRIWSTSWFRNRGVELQRLLGALEQARGACASTTPPSPAGLGLGLAAAPPSVVARPADVASGSPIAEPYQIARLTLDLRGAELHEVWTNEVADWVQQVVSVESPVHEDEVIRRIREASGYGKAGSRIRDKILEAAGVLVRRGSIERRGDFLWSVAMMSPPVRDRRAFPPQSKKLAFVASEEIEAVIRKVVGLSFQIRTADVPDETVRHLGFDRVTQEMRQRVSERLDAMVKAGALHLADGRVTLAAC